MDVFTTSERKLPSLDFQNVYRVVEKMAKGAHQDDI